MTHTPSAYSRPGGSTGPMKSLPFLLVLIAALLSACGGGGGSSGANDGAASPLDATATVSWLPPATRANGDALNLADLSGYRVHVGTESGTYTRRIFVAGSSITDHEIDGLSTGERYFFAVSAVDVDDNESPLSQEVSAVIR